jgi:phosphopantetheine adenylyltransferase
MAQKMPWITNRRCSLKPIILTQKKRTLSKGYERTCHILSYFSLGSNVSFEAYRDWLVEPSQNKEKRIILRFLRNAFWNKHEWHHQP